MLDLDALPPGRKMRILRVAAGLRLFDVATQTGIPEPRISELERGRRTGNAEEWARLTAALEQASAR